MAINFVDPTLLQLFRELMADFDSSIDTSDGSAFYGAVMRPLLQRVGPDPLEGDAEEFVAAVLDAEYGDELDTGPLSDIRRLLIQPLSVVVRAWRREASKNRATRSLQDYDLMTRDELSSRLSDFFITLRSGGTVRTSARVYFSAARAQTFTPSTRFFTGAGLNFYPVNQVSLTREEMSFQVENGQYFVDITVEAEAAGSDYVIEAGEIIGVDGIPGVVRVTNPSSAAPVDDDETKAEGVARALESITQRTLTTGRGIRVTLPEDLGSYDDIRVVEAGDPLMQRDLLYGPTSLSGIPGGVRGKQSPDLTGGASLHVGGHTDVYLRRGEPVRQTLDIKNLRDVGRRVLASSRGFTDGGPATNVWRDSTGNFVLNGVLPGDWLRFESEERQISVVGAYSLTFSGASLPGGLFQRTYEITRREANRMLVPLRDLVAEVGGSPALSPDDEPIAPLPGSPTREPLVQGGAQVGAADNVAQANVPLPLLRITEVELLNSTTLAPTGILLPHAQVVGAEVIEDLAGGSPTTRASGVIRVYFLDRCSAYATPGAEFRLGSWKYRVRDYANPGTPRGYSTATAQVVDVGGGTHRIVIAGEDYTSRTQPGDRVVGSAFLGTYAITAVALVGGDTHLTVREEDGDWFTTPTPAAEAVTICPGVLKDDAVTDSRGLAYLDLYVEATAVGAGGNALRGVFPSVSGVEADGWVLRSPSRHESFSSRDLPYISFSAWPDDATFFIDDEAAYAVRLTYESAPYITEAQDYVEDEENAPIGEDILVRHLLPSYVRLDAASDVDAAAGVEAIAGHVLGLRSGDALQASDLVDALDEVGATYTVLPMTLLVLEHAGDRTVSLRLSETQVVSDEAHTYLPDQEFISVSPP